MLRYKLSILFLLLFVPLTIFANTPTPDPHENCTLLFSTKKEMVDFLRLKHKSDPGFTNIGIHGEDLTIFVSTFESKLKFLRQYREGFQKLPVDVQLVSSISISDETGKTQASPNDDQILPGTGSRTDAIHEEAILDLYGYEGLRIHKKGQQPTICRNKIPEEKISRELRIAIAAKTLNSESNIVLVVTTDNESEFLKKIASLPNILKVNKEVKNQASLEIIIQLKNPNSIFDLLQDQQIIFADL